MKMLLKNKKSRILLLVAILVLTVISMTGCSSGKSIIGKWACINDGDISRYAYHPGDEIEFTKEYMIPWNNEAHAYNKISDGRFSVTISVWDGPETLEYEIDNGKLYLESAVFERVK